GSHGLWVGGGYASVGLTCPRYVMCVSQQEWPFVGACWADEYSVEKFLRDVLCVGRWLTTVFVVGVG
ncbi:hypothetical protein ACN4CT_10465, partial [Corynebacterium macclintockiae]|uniref:hypothetical protein n=1 Tax=Corynebacterium macclintockiae TaxID=2913501 RepID=UPI003EBA806E